jgi:hypothetical protein
MGVTAAGRYIDIGARRGREHSSQAGGVDTRFMNLPGWLRSFYSH